MSTKIEDKSIANAGADSSPRCAVSLGSASDILADMLDDPNDNGDYRLACSGMSLALLWEAIQKQEQELHELRKDKARLDSGEIMHRCCGDRVHFVKQDLRAAIDEALSQNDSGQERRPSGSVEEDGAFAGVPCSVWLARLFFARFQIATAMKPSTSH